jgi:CelD/BcsL family acetyltransferase involved in cellulose biosynthesis
MLVRPGREEREVPSRRLSSGVSGTLRAEPGGCTVEVVRDPVALEPLAPSWNRLAAPSGNPLLRHEWHLACARAFCPPGEVAVVLVKRSDEIVAIAPLMQLRPGGLEGFEFLGSDALSEPCELLYKDAEALEHLLRALINLGRPVLLSRLAYDPGQVTDLRRRCRPGAIAVVRACAGSPWLPLRDTWWRFESNLPGRQRSRLRRAMRRAQAEGSVEVETERPSPGDVPGRLAEIFRIEAAGWKGRSGTAVGCDERLKRFFTEYAGAAAELGMLRLNLLRIGGRSAAFQLAIEHARRWWLLKIGYDEAWSRCSPGILLTHRSIRAAYERGLEAYEFLGSDEAWVHTWRPEVRTHVSIRLYPVAARCLLGVARQLCRVAVGRGRKAVPAAPVNTRSRPEMDM